MCFIVTNPIPKIALKNIVCYKILNNNHKVSIHYAFMYIKNQKNRDVKLVIEHCAYMSDSIEKGYHSYITFKEACSHKDSILYESIYKFIIPKGAEYYENTQEYVSSNIMLLKKESKFKIFLGKIFIFKI